MLNYLHRACLKIRIELLVYLHYIVFFFYRLLDLIFLQPFRPECLRLVGQYFIRLGSFPDTVLRLQPAYALHYSE